ncbi:MAG: DUF4402 domain-containing protein [Bacteroidales bacterium]|jgi:hypothetical protein|nr:DUF4402 domain-containing protein [Bacteroidales bacterium]MCZ2417698.1 DUF4402 domain-containing protein [Burkholderiales bacterium]OQC58297.1 MAG: hypothetical protein BWX52_00478 [Bacteroidetes bacterium ADurb.Bin013]MBP8998905.1 DUF4402 domain-containing protein [Bacteroidales bacterium]NLZ09181.1 DUF4402 domain-containing protein [Bacteroidales bacterium]
MKTTLKIFALSVALFAFSNISFGQGNTAEATATAGANIITPIGITVDAGSKLQFGDLIATSSDYKVTIAPDGTRTSTGDAAFFTTTGFSAVSFTVTGEAGAAFSITLPEDETIDLTGDGNDMALTDFTSSVGLSSSINGTAGSYNSGSKTFTVGATLSVGENQAAGQYSATFDVTVAYE